jgi:hypothetical protein
MSAFTKSSSDFRLGLFSEAFSSHLALAVGSLVNKNYHNDLFKMISSIPVTSDDTINVPFTVVISLIMQSHCSEFPSLDIICPLIVEKLLAHCYSNAKPDIRYNTQPSFYPTSYLYSGDYLSLIRQYMNEIDQHQFLGLEDKFTQNIWQTMFFSHTACKGYEKTSVFLKLVLVSHSLQQLNFSNPQLKTTNLKLENIHHNSI